MKQEKRNINQETYIDDMINDELRSIDITTQMVQCDKCGGKTKHTKHLQNIFADTSMLQLKVVQNSYLYDKIKKAMKSRKVL